MKLCPKCHKQFSDDANFCPVDAARLSPMQAQAGGSDPLATRFELGERLGGGRTGAVHRARDKQSGAAVAVKLVAPSVVALPGVSQRLERELKQLERVQSAGVAKVFASGKRGEETWVALELLDGAQTLADAIRLRGPIALEQAAHLIEVVGEALIGAAQVGVVHRDLAPKNVLFTASGDIKLINFSLPVPTTEKIPGVPEFVAPEQVEGKPVDQRSNLYSLGALYYFVLTGQPVHVGSAAEVHGAHVHAAVRPPSELGPVPAEVEAVILRALDRSPTKRFLTVRQFVDEVARVARREANPGSTMPMGKAGARPRAELVQTLLGVRSINDAMAPLAVPGSAPTAIPASAMVPSAPVVAPAPGGTAGAQPTPAAPMQAPAMQAPIAVATSSPVAMPAHDRSPWASPAAQPASGPSAPTVTTPPVAPPAVAAPVVAAPVVAAPVVAQPAASKRRGSTDGGSKGKFRETMWFKKGDLDAQAAVAAAEERERTGKDVAGEKADSLPMDERYKDDGSISRGDKEKYSLRTGATEMMPALRDSRAASQSLANVSEDALIGEMKRGRGKILIAIAIGLALIGALIAMVV